MCEKAYRLRLYPTEEQKTLIDKTIGCTRYIYN
ncbi:MAG: helix-turn-helix domain-containing protein, partial [Desulfitobacteriaceae bacterium]|nr:helix-turn-helix domain-containing protein [Desulfitobacteriaceae bacterium]